MNEQKDLGKLWAERMTRSERDQNFPDSVPRDAATLMLIDRSGATPKVLLGRRHHGHKFMPGKFVFPGGRLEPHDAGMSSISDLHPDIQAKLNIRVASPGADFARALALTAIRETAEETGLLLGVRRGSARTRCTLLLLPIRRPGRRVRVRQRMATERRSAERPAGLLAR